MAHLPIRGRRQLDDAFAPMERLMGQFLAPWWGGVPAEEISAGGYPTDIREEDGKLIVDAELPGFKREEVNISIDKGVLNIRAERSHEEPRGTSHLNERRYTRVDRSFRLPANVDESKVSAKLDHGVLHVELPETAESTGKRIEIE